MANRFDYVKYDEHAVTQQQEFKGQFQELEKMTKALITGRAKSLIMTKLEEAYMWVGKAIRDDQVGRNEDTHQEEERSNS